MAKEYVGEGKKAPAFALPDQNGKLVRLSDFRGRKVVLYFYVRDDTPGCTRQACDFRDRIDQLKSKDVAVIGVSPDPVASHERFSTKYGLSFPLLSDEKAVVAKKYGVWGKKNMYGRTYYGVIRSTFLIGEDGKIMKEYRRVKVNGHLNQILKELRGA